MRIMVTGCAGLIGSWLAKGFLQQGYDVIGVDNMSGGMWSNLPPLPSTQFHFFQADLTNYADTQEIFMSQRPEVIFHCASCARESASEFQPYKITSSNIMATIVCLELALKYGMKRWIQFSSIAIYGDQEPPFSEKMPRKPIDVYAINKAAIEQIIEQMADTHGFEYVILRPHNCFSAGENIQDPYRGVITIFMNRIMRKEPIYLYGENHVRAFSYIEDCLPAMMKCLDSKKAIGETINLGGIEPITVGELAEEIISNFPEYPRPEIIQLPPRPHEVARAWSTTSQSIKLLQYEERIGWKEGIKRMAKWAKKLGKQEWKYDNLPLLNDKAPKPWLDLAEEQKC